MSSLRISLAAQRLDRIQARRFPRRIKPEEYTSGCSETERHGDRVRRNRRRPHRIDRDRVERIDDIAFDAVSLSIDDGVRLLERTGGVLTTDVARATLSNWWE